MADEIPRRMKRFYRAEKEPKAEAREEVVESLFKQMPKKAIGDEEKEVTMHLTLQEVRKFKAKHKRYPKKDEYDQIAENIYEQLKDEERREKIQGKLERELKRAAVAEIKKSPGRKRRGRGKEAKPLVEERKPVLKEAEIKELSVADVFAAEKKPAEGKPVKSAEKSMEEEFSIADLGEEKAEECPTCGKESSNIVFCSECGTAFCPLCAKGSEKIAGQTMLVCPSCGKKVRQ